MTNDELNAIEARCEKATPGPWKSLITASGEYWIAALGDSDHDYREDFEPIFESSGRESNFKADAKFVAANRQDVPRLLAKVRQQKKDLEYYRRKAEGATSQLERLFRRMKKKHADDIIGKCDGLPVADVAIALLKKQANEVGRLKAENEELREALDSLTDGDPLDYAV